MTTVHRPHQPAGIELPATRNDIRRLDRRRFLSLLGSAGALGAVGCSSSGAVGLRAVPPDHDFEGSPTVDPADGERPPSFTPERDRQLVVIELQGGNDGLAMLSPRGDGRLRDLRPDLVVDDTDLLDAGSGFGWNANLSRLHALGVAGVLGVGSNEPDFSHFEMEQRWWRGDSRRRSRASTGFFGRLCDQLDVGAPVTGVSLAGGPSPALLAEKAVTVGLTDPDSLWFFRDDDPWLEAFRGSIAAMGEASASDGRAHAAARRGLTDTMQFADAVASLEQGDTERYAWSELGQQLRVASEVLRLDVGVRVLHVRLGGFDTHTGQRWRHDALMEQIDESVSIFMNDLEEQGRLESTLIATTSEFGRRAEQNDGGTDHGGASTMLLCGAGVSGLHGEAPNLRALDDGNVVATARFEDYYATIAEDWFGIPVSEVLPAGGDPISGLLA